MVCVGEGGHFREGECLSGTVDVGNSEKLYS